MRKILAMTLAGGLLLATFPNAALAGDRHAVSNRWTGVAIGAAAAVVGGLFLNALQAPVAVPSATYAPPPAVYAPPRSTMLRRRWSMRRHLWLSIAAGALRGTGGRSTTSVGAAGTAIDFPRPLRSRLSREERRLLSCVCALTFRPGNL